MSGVVLLAGRGRSSRVVFHALDRAFGVDAAIIEAPPDRRSFLRARMKKLGPATVAGQLLFRALVVPPLERRSAARIRELLAAHQLDDAPIPAARRIDVPSVNAPEAREALARLEPRVVVVNGTRIIGKSTLAATSALFINTHAGITPAYRGVHGGYWALVEGERERCGVTVHLVDAGIDTGNVIDQARVEPTAQDNFVTYPILQLAAGVPLLLSAVRDALAGNLSTRPHAAEPSRLWSHPTIGEYLRNRIFRGVR